MQDFRIDVWFGCYTPDSILLEKKYECRNNNDVLSAQDDFRSYATQAIKEEMPDLEQIHKYTEKIYIVDYEAYLDDRFLGLKISDNPLELYDIFSAIEELNHLTDERVQLYIELVDDFGHMGAVKKVQDSLAVLLGNFHSREFEVGHYFIHKLFSIEIPDQIQPYFNYEAYGKDLILNNYTLQVGNYMFFID